MSPVPNPLGTYLEKVSSPDDVKKMSSDELKGLCADLRNFIIRNASLNGGHFGSSLGTVEITVALHKVFSSPYDKIIWDVGHQAYGHKLLTGRKEVFHTNRKKGGISGFPKPSESEHDAFVVGHSSTSLSALLGMATASKLKKENRKHVAVIGDGALTGGIAFEGMNNCGDSDADVLIVVNDNQISIDENVGALKQCMVKLTKSHSMNSLRWKIKNSLQKHLGGVGKYIDKAIGFFDQKVKNIFFRNHNFFESLNFQYWGPVDGHDVKILVQKLEEIKDIPGPKILHILTTKGKGFPEAEKNQIAWHATSGFSLQKEEEEMRETEANGSGILKYQDVFGETLVELAEKNKRIIGITPAMPSGCSLNKMISRFPDRAFDVGICEQHAVTFSAGLALQGMTPFCNIYSTFAQRAYDQIIHDVCIEKTPVIFCFDRAGLVGEDGETHQGMFDIAFLRVLPNIIIFAPLNEHELRHGMKTAEKWKKGPFVIRYPRGKGVLKNWRCEMNPLEIGKGRCLKEGTSVAILSLGTIGNTVQKVLSDNKYSCVAHYDMRFVKPLDEELLHFICQKFSKIITVEEGVIQGGFGSAVLEFISEKNYDISVERMGIPDAFISHATADEQRAECGIDEAGIRKVLQNYIS